MGRPKGVKKRYYSKQFKIEVAGNTKSKKILKIFAMEMLIDERLNGKNNRTS